MKEPIRILQVVTTMNLGGLENFLMNLYRNMDRSKIQFDFLMHRQEESVFDKEILELGGRIYRLNPLQPQRYFQYQSDLKSFFKNHPEYFMVHSHINANSTLIFKVAKKHGIPIRIAHSHISATAKKHQIFRELLKRQLPKLTTHRLACSQDAGKWLYGNNSFQIFNNSIDTLKFQFNSNTREKIRTSLGLKEEDTLIGNVGRFNTQKNHEFLIRVFAKYHATNPNSKLILIGEGDLIETIQEQIKDLGLDNHVIFTGAIQNSQDYLSAMDLYLFPSLFEGLPLALVEAQTNGLPILMSDTIPQDAILTDLIHQESLVNPEQQWVKKIEDILETFKNKDRKTYQKKIVDKGFDVVKNAKEIEEFYISLSKNVLNA